MFNSRKWRSSRILNFLLNCILNLNEIIDFVPLLGDHDFKVTTDTLGTTNKQTPKYIFGKSWQGSFTLLVIVWLFRADKIPLECFVMDIWGLGTFVVFGFKWQVCSDMKSAVSWLRPSDTFSVHSSLSVNSGTSF